MTSEEIKAEFGVIPAYWLKEIAYQLAVMNERRESAPIIEVERSEQQKLMDIVNSGIRNAPTQGGKR